MRKWSFFDTLLGTRKPKSFKKETRIQLQRMVLTYLQNYGKVDWRKVEDIAQWLLSLKGDYNFKDKKVWNWFATCGMNGEICNSTHFLRLQGYPIIAGTGKKGYRYADENCDDVDEVWEERQRAWEKSKENIEKQRQIDIKLIEKVIEKIKDEEKKKKLIEVMVKYKKREK